MKREEIKRMVQETIWQDMLSEEDESGKRCSALAAGKKATVDGSVLNCYTCDGPCDFRLIRIPAASHEEGEAYVIDYQGIPGGSGHDASGQIPEVAKTNQIFSAEVPMANDRQVFISENTCLSKIALSNLKEEEALLDYHTLPALTLQRASTASEAVDVMGNLIETYGFRGVAESFIISDPNEIWNVEVVGDSTIWVAERIPDDAVIYHANRLRIQEIDFQDHENFRYAKNVMTWARDQGFYDPETDGPFSFERVYSAWRDMVSSVRREWRAFSLLCPSREWADNAAAYPYYVIPEQKISPQWVMTTLWRDVYEGTKYDLTKGYGAGPFGNPMRQTVKDVGRESPIGAWTTTYATVCQSRNWLPDGVGGLMWYCNDTSRTSVWTPVYCGINRLPESYGIGDYKSVDPDSAWWVCQTLETLSAIRYDDIQGDIRKVFDALEEEQFSRQEEIEKEALQIYQDKGTEAMNEYLTAYSNERCELAVETGKELILALLAKYRDGSPKREEISEEWASLLRENDPAVYFELDESLEYKPDGKIEHISCISEKRPEDLERIRAFAF